MAPSRELSAPVTFKDGGLDDNVMPMHSQALIPHPTATPPADIKEDPLAVGLGLAALLTGDFKNIKSLLTCSICDQLMYEPWTNACGHTYCYGCLSSWYEGNRRKKSCPECRTPVRHMPAPAFLIRHIVDIFVSRAEIMSDEESVAGHHSKRKEHRETVERERNSPIGLFAGTFSGSYRRAIIYDEADHVYRCGHCSHEFVPGPRCENCGADFEGEEEALQDDWSDDGDNDINLDEVEMDYEDMDDDDMDADEELDAYQQGFHRPPGFVGNHPSFHLIGLPPMHGIMHGFGQEQPSEDEEDSDAESLGSLDGFVDDGELDANGEERNSDEDDEEMDGPNSTASMFTRRQRHHVIPISSGDGRDEAGGDDDDDDDTGPTPAHLRFRRNARPALSDDDDEDEDENNEAGDVWGVPSDGRRRSRPQVIDSDDSDSETTGPSGVSLGRAERRLNRPAVNDSDSDAEPNEYEDMENNGFSPLNGGESGDEESHEIIGYGYESALDESGNDTDNTLRVEEHDEESVQWDDEMEGPDTDHDSRSSSRPMAVPDPPRRSRPWEAPLPTRRGSRQQGGVQMGSGSQPIELYSDSDSSASEEEEEEEMSVTRGYSNAAMRASRSRTAETGERENGENLGIAINVAGDEDQSSEDSLQPPRRRRRIHRMAAASRLDWNNDYDAGPGGFMGARVSQRAPLSSRVSRHAQSSNSRGAQVASPSASRPHRRFEYEYSMMGRLNPLDSTRADRAPPRSYGYDANTYARSRPSDRYY